MLIFVVLVCHFIAAFAALGMPVFMPKVLPALDSTAPVWLAGVFFIIPTLCTATAAPLWGRFADKFGRKNSLLRAQLGLAAGFATCGFAEGTLSFAFGLIIQGWFGGTMAASNAYLSTQLSDRGSLAKTLNLTQLSARLALIMAPICLGALTQLGNPLAAYQLLVVLPLIATFITFWLPSDKTQQTPSKSEGKNVQAEDKAQNIPPVLTGKALLMIQFLFCFSMVVTFPYFVPYAEQMGFHSGSLIGLIYSLPHVVYLFFAIWVARQTTAALTLLRWGYALLASSALLHTLSEPISLMAARLLFGLAIVLCYTGLHQLLSQGLNYSKAGSIFSAFDASGKWAGVGAGVVASFASSALGLQWPFVISALSSGLALIYLFIPRKEFRTYEHFNCDNTSTDNA